MDELQPKPDGLSFYLSCKFLFVISLQSIEVSGCRHMHGGTLFHFYAH